MAGSGSCSDGRPRPWELPPPSGDGTDACPAVDQWQQEALVEHAAQRAEQRGRGTCPGQWQQLIEAWKEPKLDPKRLLTKALAKQVGQLLAGTGRFTYRRPARRPAQGGLLRPRAFQPVPRILVVIDTSGSMSHREMSYGVGLVAKVLNGLRLRDGIRVIAGDTRIAWDEHVFDPRKIQLRGRGGTDMAAIIHEAAAQKQHERPELIVVVTDGETPWPETHVGVPVVAALVQDPRWCGRPPAWIDTVNLY